jgi:MoxR-like ATPase
MAQVLDNKPLEYKGERQPEPGEYDTHGHPLYPYLPNEDMVEAVNLATYLKRPLLIKGEPGCGKTRLARAVAYELDLPYEAWHVKSTSRARDGLYTYDTVGRLRDAQLATMKHAKDQDTVFTDDPMHYVKWGPLGRAFRSEQRTVVLIDEIDKADIDFPNDLLLELDERRFVIDEVAGQGIRAKEPPIVFITSNDEKDLPDAFLRRCLFHYVRFPEPNRLREIVNAHFPDAPQPLIDAAVERFTVLRQEMYKEKGDAGKKASTSELIDWFAVLYHYPLDDTLTKLKGKLPYASVLLKSWDDHIRYLTRR